MTEDKASPDNRFKLAVTRECALKLDGTHNMFKRAVGDSVDAPDKVCY